MPGLVLMLTTESSEIFKQYLEESVILPLLHGETKGQQGWESVPAISGETGFKHRSNSKAHPLCAFDW